MRKQVKDVISGKNLTNMWCQKIAKISAMAVVVGLLFGCVVGPDFKQPPAPNVTAYTAVPFPDTTTSAPTRLGASQRLVEDRAINPHWWKDLGSGKLNALIIEALQASPTLASARATLRQAQENYAAKSGWTRYPQAEANITGQRQRFNPGSSGLTGDPREFELFNAGIGLRYNLDLFGRNRRILEALAAEIDYQRFQLAGARLALTSHVASTAISQARFASQIQATEAILHVQEEQLELTREKVRLGQAAPEEILTLQTRVEQTRADIPLLLSQLQRSEHLLAVLAGKEPGAAGTPSFSLQDFNLPVALPLIVPSELVRARPDIQAAEALLQKANAEYGVAIANLYPQLNLSANLGSQALSIGGLFGSGSAVWNLAGQLTQPLFNSGLSAEKRAALAAFDAALENYRNIVLESLRNVADVLCDLENDSRRLSAFSVANMASQKALDIMKNRYEMGAADYIELLIAQQQSQKTEMDLIEVQAQRLLNSVAFLVAMGGGMPSSDAP